MILFPLQCCTTRTGLKGRNTHLRYCLLRVLLFSVFLLMEASLFSSHAFAHNRIKTFVSILPQRFFVKQIGGDLIDTSVMVKPGANPATYEPKPFQMAELKEALLYFAIGVPFEDFWLKRISEANPKMKIIRTDAGIKKMPMPSHIGHNHKRRTAGPSSSTPQDRHGLDPHVWLSPPLVKIQAKNILSALVNLMPAFQEVFVQNYKNFTEKIDLLHMKINALFSGKKSRSFMVFHPSWGYFAHTYGLVQIPVEIEGKGPRPAGLKRIIDMARDRDIRIIFAQPQFSPRIPGIIAKEINGRVVFADPLAEDWFKNLLKVAAAFSESMK